MKKHLILSILLSVCLCPILAQIPPEIEENIYANIKGFELSQFLNEAEIYKTEIITSKIKRLDFRCRFIYKTETPNIDYPDSNYKLIGLSLEGEVCNDIIRTRRLIDGILTNRFLIAVDTSKTGNEFAIKYLSGKMFLDNLSDDFKLNVEDPESFLDYIKLRMFDYDVEQIKFLKRRRKKLFYTGYSNITNQELILSVDLASWNNKIEIEKWL